MDYSKLVACHECDLLLGPLPEPNARQRIRCPRCGHPISSGHSHPIEYTLSLSITALVTLLISISFPFLSFSASGQKSTMTVLEAATALADNQFPGLAVLVYCFIVILPLLYLFFLLLLVIPLQLGKKNPLSVILGKLISKLLPWTMSDVFIVGVLVALVKIITLADLIFGVAFWAYLIFSVLFLIITSIVDKHRLWHWIEYGR